MIASKRQHLIFKQRPPTYNLVFTSILRETSICDGIFNFRFACRFSIDWKPERAKPLKSAIHWTRNFYSKRVDTIGSLFADCIAIHCRQPPFCIVETVLASNFVVWGFPMGFNREFPLLKRGIEAFFDANNKDIINSIVMWLQFIALYMFKSGIKRSKPTHS